MDEKNIDGIKKIPKKDLEKSRKIVLDSIGEAFDNLAEEKNKTTQTGHVDSIKKVDKNKKKPIKKTDDGQKKKWQKQWSSIRTDKDEKVMEDKKKPLAVIPDPPAPKPATSKPRAKKKHSKSKGFASFGKRKTKKPLSKEKSQKDTTKPKTKIPTVKIKQIFKCWKKNTGSVFKAALRSLKKTLSWLVTLALVVLFIYLVFIVLVGKLRMDNILLRKMDAYIPIPAAISVTDYVDYFKYIDAAKIVERENTTNEDEKTKIVKTIIYNDLLIEYNLNNLDPQRAEYKLKQLIIFHPDVNQVSLARIKNIDKMIRDNEDLSYQAKQYGDESGTIEINTTNENKLAFADSAKQLDTGQISKIIYTNEGYYILKCLSKTTGASTFEYIFVKANSLDEYIENKAQSSNYFFLIN